MTEEDPAGSLLMSMETTINMLRIALQSANEEKEYWKKEAIRATNLAIEILRETK